jgi:hypothetical protein
VFLLHCPRCAGETAAEDDAEWVTCRWCLLRVGTNGNHIVRDPNMVRRFLLDEIWPLAALLRTFGTGQIVLALLYFLFFFGCLGGAGRFDDVPRTVMLVAIGAVLFVSGVFVYAGAHAVYHGKRRLIAVTGAVFALTSPLLLGLPIGVWALWKLSRPEGRAVFQ